MSAGFTEPSGSSLSLCGGERAFVGGMDFASPLKRGYAELSSAQRVEFDAWVMSGYGEVDIGLKLAGLPGEILVQLAETLGNPLALLVSKAHLSKAFLRGRAQRARANQASRPSLVDTDG